MYGVQCMPKLTNIAELKDFCWRYDTEWFATRVHW